MFIKVNLNCESNIIMKEQIKAPKQTIKLINKVIMLTGIYRSPNSFVNIFNYEFTWIG